MSHVAQVSEYQLVSKGDLNSKGIGEKAITAALMGALSESLDKVEKGTPTPSIGEIVNEIGLLITALEVVESKYQLSQANGRMESASDATETAGNEAKHQAKETSKEMKKIEKEQKWSLYKKIFGPLFTAVAIGVTLVVAPEITAGTIAFAVSAATTAVLSDTGTLKKGVDALGSKIADLLKKDGMDSKKAKSLGKVFAGLVFAMSASAATLGVGAGVGAFTEGGAKAMMKGVAKQAIFNTFQVGMATNIIFNGVAFQLADADKSEQKTGAIIAEVVQMLTSLVVLIVGGVTAFKGADEEAVNSLGSLREKLKGFTGLSGFTINALAYSLESIFGMAAAIPKAGEGIVKYKLGGIQEDLTLLQGEQNFLSTVSSELLDSAKSFEKAIQGAYLLYQSAMENVLNLLDPMSTEANSLANI